MSFDSDRHRVGPALRTLAAIAAPGAGALAALFAAIAVLPGPGTALGTRLMAAVFAGGFAFATCALVVSAVRGRSPAAVPVWEPWREQLVGWMVAALILAAVTVAHVLRSRLGFWASAVVVGASAALVTSFLPRRARVERTPDERAGR